MASAICVSAERVSFGYSDSLLLFNQLSFRLERGWTGVVGPNGAGKTSLLSLLGGRLTPSSGRVRLKPGGLMVRYCDQRVDDLDARVPALVDAGDGRVHRLLGKLRLHVNDLKRWPSLSPGERRRWQLSAALAEEPELLLLDEPTNHLDRTGRNWVLRALDGFDGIGLVVSHDRELLDALCQHTLWVEAGEAVLYGAGYTAARQLRADEREARVAARAAHHEHVRGLSGRLDRARRAQDGAQKNRSTRRRMRNPNDSDARGMGAQVRADRGQAARGRDVTRLRDELSRLEQKAPSVPLTRELGRSLFADYLRCPKPHLLELPAGEVKVAGRRLFQTPALQLGRDDRVWLSGDNGAGKSTLLERILEELAPLGERLLVLPQHHDQAAGIRELEALRRMPVLARGRTLSLVAALGVDPDRLLASRQPSPGELRKLVIARGLGSHAHALILDEPENHLDLPSVERLEAALAAFPGALCLVTHDPRLARSVTRRRWHISGGVLRDGADFPNGTTESPGNPGQATFCREVEPDRV